MFSDEFLSGISASFQSAMEVNNLWPLLATGSGKAWRWHGPDAEPSLTFNWSTHLFCAGGTLKACFVFICIHALFFSRVWSYWYVASSLHDEQDELLSKELLQFQSYCKYCTIFATEVQGPHRYRCGVHCWFLISLNLQVRRIWASRLARKTFLIRPMWWRFCPSFAQSFCFPAWRFRQIFRTLIFCFQLSFNELDGLQLYTLDVDSSRKEIKLNPGQREWQCHSWRSLWLQTLRGWNLL